MLLIEKVLLLKSSDIFKDTPEQDLIDTAALLEELELEKGMPIFAKGDIGNCMYLIYKGKVRIHDNEHTFAILQEKDLFGELSLMDTETRSASATCEDDCFLLKLDQEPFYEILSNNNNVLKGILRTLSKRIRTLDEKLISQKNEIRHTKLPSSG